MTRPTVTQAGPILRNGTRVCIKGSNLSNGDTVKIIDHNGGEWTGTLSAVRGQHGYATMTKRSTEKGETQEPPDPKEPVTDPDLGDITVTVTNGDGESEDHSDTGGVDP